MSLDQLLACSQCPSPQAFNPSQPLWMCVCGHLRCNTHSTSPCCPLYPAVLGNALLDPLVKETCGYLVFLKGLGQGYVDHVYEKLAGLIVGRIEELYASFRLCATCRRVLDEVTGLCLYCRSQEEEEKMMSVSVPLPRPTSNLFLSLETLSMDPALQREPWQCPKCGEIVPATKVTCTCKYVNLKRVEVALNCEESLKPRVTGGVVAGPRCWPCPNCNYEYNMAERCTHCHLFRGEKASSMKPATPYWTCEKCRNPYNPLNTALCSSCKHYKSPGTGPLTTSWECPKCKFNQLTEECSRCRVKKADLWKCSFCPSFNLQTKKKCKCGKEGTWNCSFCTLINPMSTSKCTACQKPRKQ